MNATLPSSRVEKKTKCRLCVTVTVCLSAALLAWSSATVTEYRSATSAVESTTIALPAQSIKRVEASPSSSQQDPGPRSQTTISITTRRESRPASLASLLTQCANVAEEMASVTDAILEIGLKPDVDELESKPDIARIPEAYKSPSAL